MGVGISPFCFLPMDLGGIRTHLNAARMSAAGEGWTEPLLDFIESLIHAESHTIWCGFLFCIGQCR
jgi:hypothetical protein